MATTTTKGRANPYAAFNFVVTLSGDPTSSTTSGGSTSGGGTDLPIGGFMEASGLDGENAIIEYRNGDDQSQSGGSSGQLQGAFVRKLPGLERYPNVVLRRGICGDLKLWNMRKNIRDAFNGPEFNSAIGAVTPTLTIDLQDEAHNKVLTWTLHNVWVSKLSGPTLNAKSNEIAVESVEFVCERIEWSSPS